MSRTSALVGAFAISILSAGPLASCAFAQVPPAGSAGAGSSAISGIPAGPANPSVLSDPSGIGNAGRMAPLPQQRASPINDVRFGDVVAAVAGFAVARRAAPDLHKRLAALQCAQCRKQKANEPPSDPTADQ